jgi:aquaporin Z
MNTDLLRKCLAEYIGTFALIFAGTTAIVVNETTGGTITHAGIALTFGLTVMAGIFAVGDVSGAHFNPAVSLAFWLSRRIPTKETLCYIATQCTAAISASLTVRLLFPYNTGLGATQPSGTITQSFILEVLMTFFLVFVIFSVSTGAKEKGITAAIAIGGVVALEALFGGPISGASMNPARSLGPAFISGNPTHLWIYIAAPIIGAAIAVPTCKGVRENCCPDTPEGSSTC